MAKSSPKTNPSRHQMGLTNLLYESLETELGGVQVYTNAIRFALDEELRGEWQKYLAETTRHVQIVRGLLAAAGRDPDAEVPARLPVRLIGETLVQAMLKSTGAGDPEVSQLVAARCVFFAETADRSNWELLQTFASSTDGALVEALVDACEEVLEQEDEHLSHSRGWARELGRKSLGLAAELPPAEEQHPEVAADSVVHP